MKTTATKTNQNKAVDELKEKQKIKSQLTKKYIKIWLRENPIINRNKKKTIVELNEWNPKWRKMNCISMQQEKKNYQQRNPAYQPNNNTTSRVGLRSCLRGEIEDTECKIESVN